MGEERDAHLVLEQGKKLNSRICINVRTARGIPSLPLATDLALYTTKDIHSKYRDNYNIFYIFIILRSL